MRVIKLTGKKSSALTSATGDGDGVFFLCGSTGDANGAGWWFLAEGAGAGTSF